MLGTGQRVTSRAEVIVRQTQTTCKPAQGSESTGGTGQEGQEMNREVISLITNLGSG